MAEALQFLGLIIALIGGIWIIVLAFQESIWWGLGCIFVPFVSLIFAIMHWNIAAKPFLISLAGGILYGIGIAMAGGTSVVGV